MRQSLDTANGYQNKCESYRLGGQRPKVLFNWAVFRAVFEPGALIVIDAISEHLFLPTPLQIVLHQVSAKRFTDEECPGNKCTACLTCSQPFQPVHTWHSLFDLFILVTACLTCSYATISISMQVARKLISSYFTFSCSYPLYSPRQSVCQYDFVCSVVCIFTGQVRGS